MVNIRKNDSVGITMSIAIVTSLLDILFGSGFIGFLPLILARLGTGACGLTGDVIPCPSPTDVCLRLILPASRFHAL